MIQVKNSADFRSELYSRSQVKMTVMLSLIDIDRLQHVFYRLLIDDQ